jgi:hypothetical protein
MCVVSMVSDWYNDDWRKRQYEIPQVPIQPWPQTAQESLPWTDETFKLLKDIMEKMKALDTKLGLPDCEDPKKAEWMKSIESRLKKLEKKKRGT